MRSHATFLCSFAGVILLSAHAVLPAQDASLIPERDWTSADGKVLRASLLGFERGEGQFRTPEGRRFVIPDERLSLRDQVAVFIARMGNQYDLNHSADINTDFYYSRHVPANRRAEKINGYVAFGPGRVNLAIILHDSKADFDQFEEIVVRGASGAPEVIYEMGEGNVRRFSRGGQQRSYARISINFGQHPEVLDAVESALQANAASFVLRGAGAEMTLTPDESEANGLREIVAAFIHASKLIEGGFLERDRLADQMIGEDAVAGGSGGESATDPLAAFRNRLSQRRYGTLEWQSETVDGVGFLGTDVVVRRSDGEFARAPFIEISEADRRRLFERRLEETFGKSKHVYESGSTVFLPAGWDSRRMIYSRSLLLTLERRGDYMLRAFGWAGNMNGTSIKEIFIRGDVQETPFLVACRPEESTARDRSDGTKNTLVAAYLDGSESEAAMGLLGAESIHFRLRSEQNQDSSVDLQNDELAATLEAIALYQWSRQL